MGSLKELKDEGEIRSIGVSNFSIDELKQANKDGYVDVYQGEYNLLERNAEKELLPYTAQNDLSFIPYFPLASGLLAGKYNVDAKFNDLRKNLPYFQRDVFKENLLKVEELKKLAHAKEVEVAHLVLAWYLTRDSIDAVIPGAKRAEQVINNLKTLEVELTKTEIEEVDQLFR